MSWASRHPIASGALQGARAGLRGGPVGAGIGAVLGAMRSAWTGHRFGGATQAGMDALSDRTTGSLNSAIWGAGWNAQPGTGIPRLDAAPDDPNAVTNTDSPLLDELGITQWGGGGGGGARGGGGFGGGFSIGSGSGSYSGGTGAGAGGVQSRFTSEQYFDIE